MPMPSPTIRTTDLGVTTLRGHQPVEEISPKRMHYQSATNTKLRGFAPDTEGLDDRLVIPASLEEVPALLAIGDI